MGLKVNDATLQLDSKSRFLCAPTLSKSTTKYLALLVAAGIVALLWQIAPTAPLDKRGVIFLATLAAGVTLWISNIFEEYVVALLLLVSWLFFQLAPARIALSGFSNPSWFFVLGVLGIGAAVSKCGLPKRLASHILPRVHNNFRLLGYIIAAIGVALTPVLPRVMARIMVVIPLVKALSDRVGVGDRSSASASLTLSAYAGCTVLTFMFMTAGTYCLVGWSLMSPSARSEFGWGTWTLAALPAGIFTFFFMMAAIKFLFPKTELTLIGGETPPLITGATIATAKELSREEWLSIIILTGSVLGWLTKPIHGISEPTVALAAFLIFLITDVLDKNSFKNDVEWGFLLFFGVVYSLAAMASHLKVDLWLINLIQPFWGVISFHPTVFLMFVLFLVYLLRLFLLPTPVVMLVMITLTPSAQNIGIHPGVLLLTILMGVEAWFMPHQHVAYALTYRYTNGTAFSHSQGRQLMFFKLVASIIGLMISVPYWRYLGFIPS